MGKVIGIVLILIQVILFYLVYKVNYQLHHFGGDWNTAVNLNEYVPYIFGFYLMTLMLSIFFKEMSKPIRIIMGIFSVCGIYLLFVINLNPF